jgi:hypothetical protein
MDTIVKYGLQVTRSFDFQVARSTHLDCSCPHHGTSRCDCQMVVLLIYGERSIPATLVIHSRNGQTELSLVDTPDLRMDTGLENAICKALEDYQACSGELWKHAT